MRVDLHIHSCLSPCAELEMSPRAIARAARSAGLELVSLADHNTARNAPAFAEACRAEGLQALFGLEVSTVEGAHVLCIFQTPEAAGAFGEFIFSRLDEIPLLPSKMNCQPVCNAEGEVEELLEYYLGGTTDIPVSDLCRHAHDAGGLCIPAHIDRPGMGLVSQLGSVPDLPFDAVEISADYPLAADPARVRGRWAMLRSSDSHYLGQIGEGWTDLDIPQATLTALKDAFEQLRVRQASEAS